MSVTAFQFQSLFVSYLSMYVSSISTRISVNKNRLYYLHYEFAFLLTWVCFISGVNYSRTRVHSLSYLSRFPLILRMQRTLWANDHRSDVKQQINQYNVPTVTKSQQPLNVLCNYLQNNFRDIGSRRAEKWSLHHASFTKVCFYKVQSVIFTFTMTLSLFGGHTHFLPHQNLNCLRTVSTITGKQRHHESVCLVLCCSNCRLVIIWIYQCQGK